MSKFGFDRVLRNIEQLKRELPPVLANTTQNYFNEAFKTESWDGVKWETPQRKIAGTRAWKYPKKNAQTRRSRAILVQSSKLRRTVATSKRSETWDRTIFRIDPTLVPYAAAHNEGLPLRHGKMPQRRFIGDSQRLRKLQISKINQVVSKIWQG